MRPAVWITIAVAPLLVTACGIGNQQPTNQSDGYPRIVDNCGTEVPISRKPERVVALGPSEVTTLVAAGAGKTLVARNDLGKADPYTPDIQRAVTSVPQLGKGGEVTAETLVAQQPDLAVGSVSETLSYDRLKAVGIPLIALRGNCGSAHAPGRGDGTADFDDVYHDVETLGGLLGSADTARSSVSALHARVDAAKSAGATNPQLQNKSAAALIIVKNGIRAYGSASMAHTQLTALGLRNVFANTTSRVFDANVENIIDRDPDYLVLLSYGESDAQARANLLGIPGAGDLKAVRDNKLLVQPYEYSSQGVLAVNGLENMAQRLPTLR
jgi:iron complex transport system substrate-binding protein